MNPPQDIADIIHYHLSALDKSGRIAISARYPYLADSILFVKCTARNICSLFNRNLSRKQQQHYYTHVVSRHQSVLIRKLGDSEPHLQYHKITNLRTALRKLDGLILPPGKSFSFWHVVGKPNYKHGYLDGMLLANGKIIEGIGGGLCQLSNLIYWLFLHTPLTITERHRHAFDVFPDSGRVLPFGSGATIMYNTIDLRARNDTDTTMQLKIWLTQKHLKGQILAPRKIPNRYHIFEKYHFFIHHQGKIYRFNEIWRETRRHGETIKIEKVTSNFSPVLYDVTQAYLDENNFQMYDI